MHHEKLLRDIRAIRERPKLREMIVRENFLPDVVRHHEKLYWDGASIRIPGGARKFAHENVTELHLELKRLARLGFWGDLRNVILDFRRYSQIRDTIDGKMRGVVLDVGLWTPPDRSNRNATNVRKVISFLGCLRVASFAPLANTEK